MINWFPKGSNWNFVNVKFRIHLLLLYGHACFALKWIFFISWSSVDISCYAASVHKRKHWCGWTWVESLNICVSAARQVHYLWNLKMVPASLQRNLSVVAVIERFYFLCEIGFVVRYFSSWRPLLYVMLITCHTHDSQKKYLYKRNDLV